MASGAGETYACTAPASPPPQQAFEGAAATPLPAVRRDDGAIAPAARWRPAARAAEAVARRPGAALAAALACTVALGAAGMAAGGFSLSNQDGGWSSRGTLIADRAEQLGLVEEYAGELREGGDAFWEALMAEAPQRDFEDANDGRRRGRRALRAAGGSGGAGDGLPWARPPRRRARGGRRGRARRARALAQDGGAEECDGHGRLTEEGCACDEGYGHPSGEETGRCEAWGDAGDVCNGRGVYAGEGGGAYCVCDGGFTHPYDGEGNEDVHMCVEDDSGGNYDDSGGWDDGARDGCFVLDAGRREGKDLIASWRADDSAAPALLAPAALLELCEAEQATLASLYQRRYCETCEGGTRCRRPIGLVSLFRAAYASEGGDTMPCAQLIATYEHTNATGAAAAAAACATAIMTAEDPWNVEGCPAVLASMLDLAAADGGGPIHSKSVFPMSRWLSGDELDEISGEWGRGGRYVTGVYDTRDEELASAFFEETLMTDMMLSNAAMFIVIVCIAVHTGSAFLTVVGVLQVFLSFPLAYFIYSLILGIPFFPFLNFLGLFVIFGIGADDVFVAVDKWRETERRLGAGATTEQIAAEALPSAAVAMLLTTSTTAAAFFGTAIAPVPSIFAFAVFLGLLVICDYLLNLLLVFPAICLQHRWTQRQRKGECCCTCCIDMGACCRCWCTAPAEQGDAAPEPLRSRLMARYYGAVHAARWFLLPVCIGSIAWCAVVASDIPSPTSSEVQLLADSHEFSRWNAWRRELIDYDLQEGGAEMQVVWGLEAADTGPLTDPETWTRLMPDRAFDPSSEAAQLYLRDFCARLGTDRPFAYVPEGQRCVFQRFDDWLGEAWDGPRASCGGATALPVPPASFHGCARQFADERGDWFEMLFYGGKLQVLVERAQTYARWNSPLDDLRDSWRAVEAYMEGEREAAPAGVGAAYHSSEDFHWYDTNSQLQKSAYQSALIALCVSAAVVLLSSRSLRMTALALVSIAFVLVAVAACTVAMGWELGFLESICFGILIGLSCDFAIHMCHAYCDHDPAGDAPRHERARGAVTHIGPPILSSALTTFATGVVLIFTQILFFQQFGVVLMLTMVLAMGGTFVVFIVFVDTVGPARPGHRFM